MIGIGSHDYGAEKSIDLPLTSQGPGKSVVSSV